jgi:predicted Zn-dependent protease with MMP-like domain
MYSLTQEEFETLVNAGIKAIPAEFLKKLDNVTIVVEQDPNSTQMQKSRVRSGWTLFGLYEGVPQAKRGEQYHGVLPDRITIFKNPIESHANSIEEVKEIVKNTVWHEIAHHFGMDEKSVRLAEERRRNKIPNKT